MKTWSRQHLQALRDAVRHVMRTPGSFLFNVLVAAIALSLPVMGWTLLDNLTPVTGRLAVEPEISIFMGVDTPRERSTALASEIRRIVQNAGGGGKLEFIPREKALDTLRNRTGLSGALATLGENPLPDAYVLKFSSISGDGDAINIERVAVQLKALPGVEYVQIDSAWVQRLAAGMRIVRIGLTFLATILGVVVVAVIFNTIRLQMMTQQEEIDVCRLFGATDSTICRPFHYTGALLGLLAALLALAMVALALGPLNDAIVEFARLYASEFRLAPLSLPAVSMLLLLGAGLGYVGAMLSVRRHLARSA